MGCPVLFKRHRPRGSAQRAPPGPHGASCPGPGVCLLPAPGPGVPKIPTHPSVCDPQLSQGHVRPRTIQPHVPLSHPHSSPKTPDSTWLHRGRGFPQFWWAPTRSSTTPRSCLVPPFPHGGSPSPLWGCGWAPRAPRAALAPLPVQYIPPGRAVLCHAGPVASTAGPAGTAAAGSEETEAQHGCPDTTEPCPGGHPRPGETRHLV